MAVEIGSIGYNHKHGKDFIQKMENGPGAFLFLLVKSPAKFIINGKNFKVTKNSYVLLHPTTPCTYSGVKDNYIDDWFYCWMNEEDIKQLQEMGIKFDEPVFLSQIEELSKVIHKISFELFSSDNYHKEIQNLYTKTFFYELARIISSKTTTAPDVLATKNERILYLRTQLFQNPSLFSNIDEMAQYVNLSRSGFQHLYTTVFGHSVIEDVIAGRIEKAKKYLIETSHTISEISTLCGYKTEYHFMRQFKQQTGFTPTEFRNSDTWNQIEASRTKGTE